MLGHPLVLIGWLMKWLDSETGESFGFVNQIGFGFGFGGLGCGKIRCPGCSWTWRAFLATGSLLMKLRRNVESWKAVVSWFDTARSRVTAVALFQPLYCLEG